MLREISGLTRDLIIIIVAATFIELLLPRKEFQRYTRMVVGLFIVFVLLSTVSRFLGVAPDTDAFFRQLEGKGGRDSSPSSLQEGLFQERVLAEFQARMGAEAERVAREFLGAEAFVRARVALRETGEFTSEVASITLYLSPGAPAAGTGIEPIRIHVGPQEGTPGDPAVPSRPGDNQPLAEYVARHFQLDPRQVAVVHQDR